MSPMEVITEYIGSILFVVFIGGAFGIRLMRTRSATLVLQKYFIGVKPQPPARPVVVIVGRMQGIIAFVLT